MSTWTLYAKLTIHLQQIHHCRAGNADCRVRTLRRYVWVTACESVSLIAADCDADAPAPALASDAGARSNAPPLLPRHRHQGLREDQERRRGVRQP
eukprot:5748630-Pleurochrysis_carterae.AAC.2